MENFWSRILAHTPLSSGSSSKDAGRDPLKRRQRFEKEYGQLLQIWRSSSNLAKDVDAAENLEIRLQELTNILTDESRRPLPHTCITFCAAKQIYVPIAKIATTCCNQWIIKEAVLFFATLIESEEEAFLENDAFSASLTNLLVRITGANSIRLGTDVEVRVVELAFNVTTKIRLEPEILPAWFKSSHEENTHEDRLTTDQRERFAGKTQKQDFPLFYLLMDYIHSEGKVGDFARTGLLYIIEAASSSVELEQWIVESDLSTLMATGLGALYSQLSRKLVIDHPPHGLPPVLALSDYQHPTSTFEITSSCSADFQLHLETFLSHLLFWQDVLNHCRSTEVKSTLLEHFQVIFLQQLLYPSLLESSDVDGGSSVAVLTYLRRILESLDHPDMINLILHYLLALPSKSKAAASRVEASVVTAARKRKSMDLATMMASKVEASYTPLLFNLVDLIHSCLRSRNHQTVCVTLQLLSTILKRHHRYAVVTLLLTEGVHGSDSHRTVGAHQQDIEYITSLASSIGGEDDFDEIYDKILRDSMNRLEAHTCSLSLIAPRTSAPNHKLPVITDSLSGAPRDVPPHTLSAEDPLLNTVIDILQSFFINPVETNLSVTETILGLAVCGYITIEGWLLRHPDTYVYDDDADELAAPLPDPSSASSGEVDKLQAMSRCRRRPRWEAFSLPRILHVLDSLCLQVAWFRKTVPRFDELLQQRRESFRTADAAVRNQQPARPATPLPAERFSTEELQSPPSPKASGFEGFAQRFFSELGTQSRSSSPRSRAVSGRSATSTLSGGYGIAAASNKVPPAPASTPPPPPPPPPPKDPKSPTQVTGQAQPGQPFSPGSSSGIGAGDPVASQAAAFVAVDQSILARRIQLPAKIDDDAIASKPGEDNSGDSADVTGETREATLEGADGEGTGAGATEESDAGHRDGPGPDGPSSENDASVSHVLTNVIIFQFFLLELAGLVQVRAGMFNEVRFV